MSDIQISFFTEDIQFNLSEKDKITNWIRDVLIQEQKLNAYINYIFCSDRYILDINKEYLDHDYFTDIITFDQSEDEALLESDIYISIERIKENAEEFGQSFSLEFKRVLIHGVLHLLGYGDKTEQDQIAMRKKEDACLSLYENY